MREFQDEGGVTWVASVRERVGDDYKGRYHLVVESADGSDEFSLGALVWTVFGRPSELF
jgi:hypothetical protein